MKFLKNKFNILLKKSFIIGISNIQLKKPFIIGVSNIQLKRSFIIGISLSLIVLGSLIALDNINKLAKGNTTYTTGNKSLLTKGTPKINQTEGTSEVNQAEGTSAANQAEGTSEVNQAEHTEINNIKFNSKVSQIEKDPVLYPKRPQAGDEFGELYIPKLNISYPIYEGTSDTELDMGVGHYTDSVLPGENDNSVLAGHRDTVFRKLGQVGKGDLLIVRTSAGEFKYKVNKVRIVEKDDHTVIVPKPRATLTLSTCYPFEYIGSAPERYILVAYLESK